MANRTGIELLPHACRIVEVAPRARLFGEAALRAPRVRAFREIPYSAADPGALTGELRKALKGLERRASVAVWGLRSSHQALLLPPSAASDLEAAARREARGASGLPPAPLADAVVAGTLRDGHRETGHAAVSADELRARLQPLVDAGVTAESVTTPALAHASLVRQRETLLPDAVVAVLSVNAQATAITVVHGGVVLFARELPWGDQTDRAVGGQSAAGRAAFAARIAAELKRSLVYLRQSQKAEVSRVLVCGDLLDIRSLTGPLQSELAIDIETLDVGDDLDLSKLPDQSDGFLPRLGAWRTALALAADPAPVPGLRAPDAGPTASPALAPRVAAAAVAGLLIAAAGWGVLGYLSAGVTARQERLRRIVAVLGPELQRLEDERRRASVAAAREAALAAFASQGPRLARIMEAFSQAVPAEVALTTVRAEPGVASWRLLVEGQAEGADAGAAHATLNRFVKALAASPLVGRPAAPPSLRARTPDAAAPAGEIPGEAGTGDVAGAVDAAGPPRPAASDAGYIEVVRDGRLYRIPLKRQAGTLEAGPAAKDARPAEKTAARRPGSVVEFALRYEVPK